MAALLLLKRRPRRRLQGLPPMLCRPPRWLLLLGLLKWHRCRRV
jgi:hypothetical protein